MPINISLPVTTIRVFDTETQSIREFDKMGKLNLKTCKQIAKDENSVLIGKINSVKDFTVEPSHLKPVKK